MSQMRTCPQLSVYLVYVTDQKMSSIISVPSLCHRRDNIHNYQCTSSMSQMRKGPQLAVYLVYSSPHLKSHRNTVICLMRNATNANEPHLA